MYRFFEKKRYIAKKKGTNCKKKVHLHFCVPFFVPFFYLFVKHGKTLIKSVILYIFYLNSVPFFKIKTVRI